MPEFIKQCEWCNEDFLAHTRDTNRGRARFCSLSCSGLHGNSVRKHVRNPECWVTVTCRYCGIDFEKKRSSMTNSKSGLFFCCREHKDLSQRLGGVKEIMPPHYGTKSVITSSDYNFARKAFCERCGYDKYPIHHVHHIDRDRTNNKEDNLICLCPNCHSEDHYLSKDGIYS